MLLCLLPGFLLSDDESQYSTRLEHLPRAFDRILAACHVNHVGVADAAFKPGGVVVDHGVGAQRAHEINIGRRRCPDHLCTLPLGELDYIRSDSTGGAVDED